MHNITIIIYIAKCYYTLLTIIIKPFFMFVLCLLIVLAIVLCACVAWCQGVGIGLAANIILE